MIHALFKKTYLVQFCISATVATLWKDSTMYWRCPQSQHILDPSGLRLVTFCHFWRWHFCYSTASATQPAARGICREATWTVATPPPELLSLHHCHPLSHTSTSDNPKSRRLIGREHPSESWKQNIAYIAECIIIISELTFLCNFFSLLHWSIYCISYNIATVHWP